MAVPRRSPAMRANRPGPRRVSRWPTITARPFSPGRGPPLYQPARPTSGTTIAALAQAHGLDRGLHARRGNRDAGAAGRGGRRRPRVALPLSAREDSPSVGCSAARARRPAEPPPSSSPIRGPSASTAAAAAAAGTSVARTNPVLDRRLSAPRRLCSAVAGPAARGRGGSRSPRTVAGRPARGAEAARRGPAGARGRRLGSRCARPRGRSIAGPGPRRARLAGPQLGRAGRGPKRGGNGPRRGPRRRRGGSGVVTAGGGAARRRRGSAARRAFAAAVTISSRARGSRRALSPGRRRPAAGRSDKATAAARRGARVAEAAQRAGDEGRGQRRQPGPVLVRQPAQAGGGRQRRRGNGVL